MTIYVGPFTGEVGYEVLYWIPHVYRKFKGKLDDVVAISRGGTDSWYPCKVLNAYDVVDPEDYRKAYIARKKTTGEYKQLWRDDKLDWEILKKFGVTEVAYHPSSMYDRLGHAIATQAPFYPIKRPERWPGLPDKYVAVRFYENEMLTKVRPASNDCNFPTVALVPKKQIDNHPELPIEGYDHLVEYDAHNSLEVVTRVVAHSQGFACTYGGLSYLGPLLGIPTKAFTRVIHTEGKHLPAEARLGPNFTKELI